MFHHDVGITAKWLKLSAVNNVIIEHRYMPRNGKESIKTTLLATEEEHVCFGHTLKVFVMLVHFC